MRPRTIGITASLMIAGSCAFSAQAGDPPTGEPIKLTHIWQPGMTTYYRIITETDSKTVTSGSTDERTSRDRTAAILRMEVYSVRDDGTARVATTVTRIRRQSEGSSKAKDVYDSANPPEKPLIDGRIYGLVVNKTIILEITPEGRMLHIQGVDEIVQSLVKSMESEYPELTKFLQGTGIGKGVKDVADRIGSQMLSSDSLNSNTGRRIGEHWPVNQQSGVPFFGMQGSSEGTSTFESVDLVSGRRIAHISTVGTSSVKPGSKPATELKLPFPMPAFETSRTTHGLYLFDLDRGRLVRWETCDSGNVKTQETKFGEHTMPSSDMQMKSSFLMELVGPEDSIDPQSEGTKGK